MSANNATLTVFKSQPDAEAAVRQLARDGYDLSKVSMVGCDAKQEQASTKIGASWGGIKEMLVGSGFFLVPGIGPLVVAGPLLTWIVQLMGPEVGPDKLGAMAGGLQQLGIPTDSITRCEAALKSGKVVIIAEGSAMAMIHAREVFRRTPVEVIEQHLRLPPTHEQ